MRKLFSRYSPRYTIWVEVLLMLKTAKNPVSWRNRVFNSIALSEIYNYFTLEMPVKLLLVRGSIALGVELINRFLSLAARLASGTIALLTLLTFTYQGWLRSFMQNLNFFWESSVKTAWNHCKTLVLGVEGRFLSLSIKWLDGRSTYLQNLTYNKIDISTAQQSF